MGRPGVVCDVRVKKAFVPHHVSKDLLEAAQRLTFERQPQPQLRPVQSKALADPGRVDVCGADDLYAGNDFMPLHWYPTNATQLTTVLAAGHNRARQYDRGGNTEDECVRKPHVDLRRVFHHFQKATRTTRNPM